MVTAMCIGAPYAMLPATVADDAAADDDDDGTVLTPRCAVVAVDGVALPISFCCVLCCCVGCLTFLGKETCCSRASVTPLESGE